MESTNEPRSTRYELKMQCEETRLPSVRSWVRLNAAGFREAFPPRQVNSLYFDTFGLDTFNDHIEGVPERRKLRFRWYGPHLGQACGQLEIKSKNERVGWKQVQPVDAVLDLQTCDWFDLQRALLQATRASRNHLFEELLQISRPLVINTYQRDYFISADERVRLTLDYQITSYDQWMSSRPNLTFRSPLPSLMVIEFKSEVAYSRHLADVLAEFPLRASRHSKYISALDSLLER